MGGFSVINFNTFGLYQELLGYHAQLLDFPSKKTFKSETFNQIVNESQAAYSELKTFKAKIEEYSLIEVQQLYSNTFDFNKKAPLYMTYNKFDTQKERGQLLAKLKVLYEMFGLKMVDQELSDFLPLMLEFLSVANWTNDDRAVDNIEFVIMIIEDGTYAISEQLAHTQNPYYYLIRSLRKTLKACIEQEQMNEVK
ncbi:nitrate reductase molybdenum cofactor assembly chaperone [Staphylococcus gallinarum]|uniref:Nitrate reductase molybdenum cofactor assembly chaperone n=1 Tax=Staphylococcus gallinarum TaxID=1293 RepID=A0A3A0W9X2_STAGA|nr:nitrate reductase molybdenum cofactor assembly chaperone [Staphylococcus gallinarum]